MEYVYYWNNPEAHECMVGAVAGRVRAGVPRDGNETAAGRSATAAPPAAGAAARTPSCESTRRSTHLYRRLHPCKLTYSKYTN